MSFFTRFTSSPSLEQIMSIEGVTIIDQAPPADISGPASPSGVACLIGEFPDCTYATAVSSTGVVTSRHVPVEILSAQDQLEKLGGFDSTLGDWGDEGGNGHAFLNGRPFSKLVVVPINMAGDYAIRLWRNLPTNASTTNATATPPQLPGVVLAGREFKSVAAAANKLRLAKRHVFTATPPIVTSVIASSAAGGAAATDVITVVGADFTAAGVQIGDIAVYGVVPTAGAGTYRITAVGTDTITVQTMDGTSFDLGLLTSQPLRIHKATDADSGGNVVLATTSGYTLPARPTAQTIAAATVDMRPTEVPDAIAATTADALSGLMGATHPSGGLTFVSAVHTVNTTSNSTLEALYALAIAALSQDAAPASTVTVVASARCAPNINTLIKSFVVARSGAGRGVVGCIAPKLTVSTVAALVTTTPGVASFRSDRIVYSAPGLKEYLESAVGTSIEVGDGTSVTDGYIDVHAHAYMFSILSILPPERNPGEPQTEFTSKVFNVSAGKALGWQRATAAIAYTKNNYISLKQAGIAAPKFDSVGDGEFQSGVTTSLTTGLPPIARRRFADFVQDSLGRIATPFNKLIMTPGLEDSYVSQCDAFLSGLVSAEKPEKSRMYGYVLDRKGGNTDAARALGVFKLITRCKMHPSGDYLVIENQTGTTVQL